MPLDLLVIGTMAYKTLFYKPKLVVPSRGVGLLGLGGRVLGFVVLSAAYFAVINHVKEVDNLNSKLVKEMVVV